MSAPAPFLALLLALPAVPLRAQDAAPELHVSVDPRVELLSVVFRLAGNPEYGKGRIPAYTRAVEQHFGPHRDHPVVKLAEELRRRRGVSYDAVMAMAVHMKEDLEGGLLLPLEPWPDGLDKRWPRKGVERFQRRFADFVQTTRARRFLEERQELYALTVRRARKALDTAARLQWFQEFFGHPPKERFELVLALLNGGACYGPHVTTPNGRILYCVLGVWKTDPEGLPGFEPSMVRTVAHEFCHSFANPLVDGCTEELEPAGKRLYSHVADAMRSQAYGSWQTMMRESLVRACVVRYVAATEGEAAARNEVARQQARSFHWTGELAGLLARYEEGRDQWADLGAFMPEVASFFEGYAARFEERMEKAPRVVAMVPENGAGNVDPGLTEIRVTFDRPMAAGSWAFVGGGPHYPETTGPPRYDATRTTVTLPVTLKPSWRYELWLNRGRFDSFRSAEGVPLVPVHVTFTTGAAR